MTSIRSSPTVVMTAISFPLGESERSSVLGKLPYTSRGGGAASAEHKCAKVPVRKRIAETTRSGHASRWFKERGLSFGSHQILKRARRGGRPCEPAPCDALWQAAPNHRASRS